MFLQGPGSSEFVALILIFRNSHERLADAIVLNTERVVVSLDAQSSLKLLQMFILTYGPYDGHPVTRVESEMPHRHRRGLYLIFNKCSTTIK